MRRFSREHAVLAVDLPGFGRSADAGEPLGIVELASVCAEWLDAAEHARVAVVGNSMGCQVAVELAASRPDLVAALVLVGLTTDPAARSLAALVPRLAADALCEPPVLTGAVVFDFLLRAGPLRTIATARLMLEHSVEEHAAAVVAPTLVVRGERDAIAPQSWCRDLASRFPRGRYAEIEGAAHAAHFTIPRRFSPSRGPAGPA